MKSLLVIVLLGVVGALGAFIFFGQIDTYVDTAAVERDTALDTVPGTVSVEAAINTVLKAIDSGRIMKAALPPGQTSIDVREGEILFQQDIRPIELQIEAKQAEIEALERKEQNGSPTEVALLKAEDELQAKQDLRGTTPSELRELRRAVTRVERQLAFERIERETNLARLQTEIKQLEVQREDRTIRAPADGRLLDASAFTGDYVQQGDPLGQFVSDDLLTKVSVSEENFSGLETGQDVFLNLLGFDGQTFAGTVAEIEAVSDPITKRRNVVVALADPPEGLVPGLTGEASIVKARRENSLIIPRRALIDNYVFVAENGTARRRQVEVGFRGLIQAEILSGLEEGDRVVTSNVTEIEDGEAINTEANP